MSAGAMPATGLLDRAEELFAKLKGTLYEQQGLKFLLEIFEQEKDWSKAIETSQVRVSDTPPLAGSTERTFKSEAERANAAITEFQAVAEQVYGCSCHIH